LIREIPTAQGREDTVAEQNRKDEYELYRCPLIKGEFVLTNRRLITLNYYDKGIQQLHLRDIRSVGARSHITLFGTQHVVYFSITGGSRFGSYAEEPWSGVFLKTRKEADALVAKIQQAMLGSVD
jgi:hypothetical protein